LLEYKNITLNIHRNFRDLMCGMNSHMVLEQSICSFQRAHI